LWSSVILLTFLSAGVPWSAAQGDKPQLKRPGDNTPDKPPAPKKKKIEKEPRAVGVLQLSGNGKGMLVPVAILIDGKFYDASVYKADPVPMALESGTVYEAEQAGDPQGLFTVKGALHSKSPGSANPWVGSGVYLPEGADAPKTTRKAEDVPVGLDSSGDEPPRLTRKDKSKAAATTDSGSASAPAAGATEKAGGASPAGSQPASGSATGGSSGSKAADQSAKQPAAQTGAGQGTTSQPQPSQPTTSQPAPGASPPAQAPSTQAAPAQASTSTASPSQSASGQASSGQSSSGQSEDSYYRPTLRRGKPTAAAPADKDEGVTAIAMKKGGKAESAATAAPVNAGPVQMVAAISDAAGPEPQSYKFYWKTGEEEERRNQMLALAENEVRIYAAALAKNQIPAQTVVPKAGAAGRKGPVKAVQPVFENVQFRAFDVWLTNQPVMIFSGEARIPEAGGAVASAQPFNVVLVARTDIYGDLRKLYSGVTDKFHLDVTPRLELIDVVDADGDKRGELLFHETSDAGSGYVIYRATGDKLWKMFDSLRAE
jgi:hypothetical protein